MIRNSPTGFDELQMRAFWREWDKRMTGTEHPPEVPIMERAGRVDLPYHTRILGNRTDGVEVSS
ncbi:MAG: hypothetical protein R2710_06360 [Acidimicrobiales bacterium]